MYNIACTSVAEPLTYTRQHVACFRSNMFPVRCLECGGQGEGALVSLLFNRASVLIDPDIQLK